MMHKKLLFFLLVPVMGMSQVQIGQDIDGDAPDDMFGCGVAMSADGSVIAVGAPRSAVNGGNSGQVRVFQNVSGTWGQIGQDIGGTLLGEGTGHSISLSSNGKILAIGNPWNNNGSNLAGYLQVYQNVSGVWTQLGQDIIGNTLGENLGFSTALSSDGTILAAGAPYYDGKAGTRSGQVRVYQNVSGNWIQLGQDIDDGEVVGEFSGWGISLSSDGDILAVGTHRGGDPSTPAKVRVYSNVSGAWTKNR